MSSTAAERSDAPDSPRPAISVVIPTHRRPGLLSRALDALDGQLGADAEVLVVDDAGDDPEAVALAIGVTRPYPVCRPDAPRPGGAAAARNAGWRAARAPIVLFLQDDILADEGLVAGHLAAHARLPAREVAVLGHVRWADELRVTAFMRFLEEGVQFDYAHMEAGDVGWGRLYTANVSFKRELLAAVDGFDETFTIPYEDLELGRRLHDHGLHLEYVPGLRAQHVHPATLASFQERMRATAPAERLMVTRHPDVAPYFRDALRDWQGRHTSAWAARLADVVPAGAPLVGPRVHDRARAHWKARLADAFFSAWPDEAPG